MLIIMWGLVALVFFDSRSNSDKRDIFPDEKLIKLNNTKHPNNI